MKVTVLSDNISADGLRGEWGLSLWIEDGENRILLDAGASPLFAENAKALGITLDDATCAVLSHAHYDHANGLETFFHANTHAKCYFRAGTAPDCYGKKWIFRKYIGIPRTIQSSFRDRIEYADGNCQIADGVYLIPHRLPNLERLGQINALYRQKGRRLVPDGFAHEQSLVFNRDDGVVLFSSCSHAGADAIAREVSVLFHKPVVCMIGGFHLFRRTDKDVLAIADGLHEVGVKKIYTGHCTGHHATELLCHRLDQAEEMHVGMTMEI